jgi:hypothetical protein
MENINSVKKLQLSKTIIAILVFVGVLIVATAVILPILFVHKRKTTSTSSLIPIVPGSGGNTNITPLKASSILFQHVIQGSSFDNLIKSSFSKLNTSVGDIIQIAALGIGTRTYQMSVDLAKMTTSVDPVLFGGQITYNSAVTEEKFIVAYATVTGWGIYDVSTKTTTPITAIPPNLVTLTLARPVSGGINEDGILFSFTVNDYAETLLTAFDLSQNPPTEVISLRHIYDNLPNVEESVLQTFGSGSTATSKPSFVIFGFVDLVNNRVNLVQYVSDVNIVFTTIMFKEESVSQGSMTSNGIYLLLSTAEHLYLYENVDSLGTFVEKDKFFLPLGYSAGGIAVDKTMLWSPSPYIWVFIGSALLSENNINQMIIVPFDTVSVKFVVGFSRLVPHPTSNIHATGGAALTTLLGGKNIGQTVLLYSDLDGNVGVSHIDLISEFQ